MAKTTQKVEYTQEEKLDFVTNNLKITFWAERELVLEFDKIAKAKGYKRKDAILKLMEKFVAKNKISEGVETNGQKRKSTKQKA